jgi:flagellar hook-associated protein 1 FlgK
LADLLSIGITGLHASKKGLETTGHNLSNANTEGYSRQKIDQTTNPPVLKGGLVHGTGTRIASISRYHDSYLEKRLNSNVSDHHFFDERQIQMNQLENIFNEVDSEGLNQLINKFFNSFRELANQPENETIRSVVRDNARLVVKDFKRIYKTLNNISRNIDQKIINNVKDINHYLHDIAQLNKRISILESSGDQTGDLRDQRDLAVKNLSKFFHVNTYVDDNGQYVVSANRVGTLVAGMQVQELKSGSLSKEDSKNNMYGSSEIYFNQKALETKLSHRFFRGKIASLIEARDKDIVNLKESIDNIAFNLITLTNKIHQRGHINAKLETDENGNIVETNRKIKGVNFFKNIEQKSEAALKIDLSDDVKNDLSNIVSALEPNSPGDNRVAIAISKIQHEKMLDNGTTTIEEKYLQTIGEIGIETGKARLDYEQSRGILAQTQSLREKISGVSIDEEASNLVRYQQAYEASAKVMKTADEMFKTVLNIIN